MSLIEKVVSPFIDQQFPSFYRDSGKNFVAFVRAYYEWLESEGGALRQARGLLETLDIDLTEAQFIEHFKKTYISSIPESIAVDKRLLVKHVLDLYRSKGSKRAVELLFRLLFNEDIEVFVPGDYLLRPSDGVWTKTDYIEITSNPNIPRLVGRTITNSSGSAIAVVENAFSKSIGGKAVNVLYLSSVRGTFKYGDRIICSGVIELSAAPVVVGSLTAIPIENGGFGYSVGDILDVSGSGTGGKARVAAVRDENGKVNFRLINGGSGYSMNASITVSTTLNIVIDNLVNGQFTNSTSVYDTTTNANGTIVFANTSYLTLINFSPSLKFNPGDTITDGNTSARVVETLGGGGAGATFKIGDLINKEVYQLNSDIINDYVSTKLETQVRILTSSQTGPFSPGDSIGSVANTLLIQATYETTNTVLVGERLTNATLGVANLYVYYSDGQLMGVTGSASELNNANIVAGVVLISNTTSSVIRLDRTPDKVTITSNATVFTSNSTAIVANVVAGAPEFIPLATLNDLTAPTSNAVISQQVRLTDWFFPARTPTFLSNLDYRIDETLTIYNREVGTIAFLTNINPGVGYSSPPHVEVVQADVALLGESDGAGGIKGRNAIVDAPVSSESGVVTAVEVYDSGFGYVPNESLSMKSDLSEISVTGVSVVSTDGRGQGRWLGNRGFLSDIMKVQDSDYYQIYSYEVVAKRMLSTYETLVKELVHPAGYKLFGRYRSEEFLTSEPIELVKSSIAQSNTTVYTLVDREFIANNVTFTRSSNAQFLNIVQQYNTALVNVPRYNYRGVASYGGLLFEGQRTNVFTNPRLIGGTPGTPGVPPTGTQAWGLVSGITATYVQNITALGMTGVRYRLSGTSVGGTLTLTLSPTSSGWTPAAPGENWTGSLFIAQADGSQSNISAINLRMSARVGGGTAGNVASANFAPSLSAVPIRVSQTYSNLPATTTGIMKILQVVTVAGPVDITLDILWPQLELGLSASTPILPPAGTVAASTRTAETFTEQLSDLDIRQNGECTILVSGRHYATGTVQYIASISDGTDNNRLSLRVSTAGTVFVIEGRLAASSIGSVIQSGNPISANNDWKVAIVLTGNGSIRCIGTAGTTAVLTGGPSTNLTTLRLGTIDIASVNPLFGELTKAKVLPYALSDSDAQTALTSLL